MNSTILQICTLFDEYIEETGTEQEVEDNIQETETEQMPVVTEDTN